MRIPALPRCLVTLALLLGTAAMGEEPTRPKSVAPAAKPAAPAKPATAKAAPAKGKLKPVDINHATKEEIGFMLGVDLGLATRIVANRPYRTKADLVVKKVLSMEQYQALRKRVIAG